MNKAAALEWKCYRLPTTTLARLELEIMRIGNVLCIEALWTVEVITLAIAQIDILSCTIYNDVTS